MRIWGKDLMQDIGIIYSEDGIYELLAGSVFAKHWLSGSRRRIYARYFLECLMGETVCTCAYTQITSLLTAGVHCGALVTVISLDGPTGPDGVSTNRTRHLILVAHPTTPRHPSRSTQA